MYQINVDLENVPLDDANELGDRLWKDNKEPFDAHLGDFNVEASFEASGDTHRGQIRVLLDNVSDGDVTDLAQQILDDTDILGEAGATVKVSVSKDGFPVEWEPVT